VGAISRNALCARMLGLTIVVRRSSSAHPRITHRSRSGLGMWGIALYTEPGAPATGEAHAVGAFARKTPCARNCWAWPLA
jgi:hypothetical protein